VRQALRQTGPSPEIDGAPELGSDDWEVDDEGRISDARHQRIRASMRAHLERWNRHFAADIFADIEVVARERSDDDARQILGDIRLTRGAVALADARLVAELAFRAGSRAQAADLMPDAKRYRPSAHRPGRTSRATMPTSMQGPNRFGLPGKMRTERCAQRDIGRALARRCRGFEMRVLAYDPIADPAYAAAERIELVEIEDVFREADFVSVHAPHSPETDKLVNRERLALMKPSAFLINTARGGLVDESALIEALAEGRIAGAGLDVLESEPLPAGSPLRGLPNVVLTPHCAAGSISAVAAMTERCVDNILAIREGRSPGDEYLLNPEVLR